MSEIVKIMDVPFNNLTQEEFLDKMMARTLQQKKTFVVTANPEIVMYAQDHPDYLTLLQQVDFVTPDGIGIIKAADILETPLKERVTGFDLLTSLLGEANEKNLSVYFLGAKEETIQAAVKNVEEKWPNIKIIGSHNGYFDEEAGHAIMKSISAEQPDMVFAALGFPKQETWLHEYGKLVSKGILMGVGGSFDVLSGQVKRAPKWIQNLQLEWFYRLVKNPSRLGRMMVLPKFLRQIQQMKKRDAK